MNSPENSDISWEDAFHELVKYSARINAILNLMRGSETRKELDLTTVDRDFKDALAQLDAKWNLATRTLKDRS